MSVGRHNTLSRSAAAGRTEEEEEEEEEEEGLVQGLRGREHLRSSPRKERL